MIFHSLNARNWTLTIKDITNGHYNGPDWTAFIDNFNSSSSINGYTVGASITINDVIIYYTDDYILYR